MCDGVRATKRVVVVGGGPAGYFTAKELQGKFDVTLIDAKEYMEYTPAMIDYLFCSKEQVEAGLKKLHIKYRDVLTRAMVIVGWAVEISSTHVTLHDGTTVSFDYLVLALGSRDGVGATKPGRKETTASERAEALQVHGQQCSFANNILVVGGGAVGCELVGELSERYPQKKIVLVHNHPQLLDPSADPLLRQATTTVLSARQNVTLHLKTKATVNEDGSGCVLADGAVLNADLVYVATGIKPQTEPLRKHFGACLNERGYVMVDSCLRVCSSDGEVYENIFAAGDIVDRPEPKTWKIAMEHVPCIKANIMAAANQNKPVPFHATPEALFVSLGQYYAVGALKKKIPIVGSEVTLRLLGSGSEGSRMGRWAKGVVQTAVMQLGYYSVPVALMHMV